MKASDRGIALVKEFEGLSREVYLCPAGKPTVGYGHLIKSSETASFANGVTQKQALEILEKDADYAVAAVNRLVRTPLTQNQFDALVSFTFNLGEGALAKSSLLKELNAGHTLQAAQEFHKWINAGGKQVQGLVNRRKAESELFLK